MHLSFVVLFFFFFLSASGTAPVNFNARDSPARGSWVLLSHVKLVSGGGGAGDSFPVVVRNFDFSLDALRGKKDGPSPVQLVFEMPKQAVPMLLKAVETSQLLDMQIDFYGLDQPAADFSRPSAMNQLLKKYPRPQHSIVLQRAQATFFDLFRNPGDGKMLIHLSVRYANLEYLVHDGNIMHRLDFTPAQ